jgi:hypothetical protein
MKLSRMMWSPYEISTHDVVAKRVGEAQHLCELLNAQLVRQLVEAGQVASQKAGRGWSSCKTGELQVATVDNQLEYHTISSTHNVPSAYLDQCKSHVQSCIW